MERELARAHALLALEEQRNAALPPQVPIASAEEHARRFDAAVTEYMAFLRGPRDPDRARRHGAGAARRASAASHPGPREFFTEVDYRDPEVMRTHGYHWFDKARMAHDPHASPIRRDALLYNIFITRTEGHATGWEEMMMQAGMFDCPPALARAVYILLAQRAARALGDLQHARRTSGRSSRPRPSRRRTRPRGWLSLQGNARARRAASSICSSRPTAPATSSARSRSRSCSPSASGSWARLSRCSSFMDEFDAAGLIPASLIRWELTGRMPDDVRRMLAPARSSAR